MRYLTVIVVSICIAIGWFKGLASDKMKGIPRYKISKTDTRALILASLPSAKLDLKDSEYTATNKSSFLQAVMLALANSKPWKKNIDDCENKAFRCWVNLSDVAGISAQFYCKGADGKGNPHGFLIAIIYENGKFVLHVLEAQAGLLDPKNYKVTDISHPDRVLDYAVEVLG